MAALKATIRLLVPAAKAKPSPQIGQALGSLGVNMMQFCKQFNDATSHYVDETPVRVSLSAYADSTFTFKVGLPPSTYLIKKAAGIDKGASLVGRETAGYMHVKQVYELARLMQAHNPALERVPLPGVCKTIKATCASMGVRVVNK